MVRVRGGALGLGSRAEPWLLSRGRGGAAPKAEGFFKVTMLLQTVNVT